MKSVFASRLKKGKTISACDCQMKCRVHDCKEILNGLLKLQLCGEKKNDDPFYVKDTDIFIATFFNSKKKKHSTTYSIISISKTYTSHFF